MRIVTFIFFLFSIKTVCSQTISNVWVADNVDGTYKNPIIHADYSDPDAIRVGDDYYMISSSFNHVPGLPILHSKDLVNWQLIGHALKKLPSPYYDSVRHGGGVWAPSIRYHNNEFFIYYPDPDFGIYLVKAKIITGPWSEPILVEEGKGLIDPCPLWDDDRKNYLVHAYAGSRAGIKSIIVVKELNKEGTKVISDAVMVYDGHELDPTIEGPKFYKRNGYYCIFAPAGGVSNGWQTVLRSKNVYGPYERKVVMDQGTTSINGPHQGAWITTQTGEDWFIHFQDKEVYGRVVHLQPMKWINDWPVIGEDKDGDGKGEPVYSYRKPNVGKTFPVVTPVESDEFNSTQPGLQWQWQANPQNDWAFSTPNGSLRMYSVFNPDSIPLWNVPNILAQKFPAEQFQVTVKVSFKPRHLFERFGLVIFGLDQAYVEIVNVSDGVVVDYFFMRSDRKLPIQFRSSRLKNAAIVYLKLTVDKGGICKLGFSEDGEKFEFSHETFIAKPGKWVGAKIGMYCSRINITNDSGYADIDWFRIESIK